METVGRRSEIRLSTDVNGFEYTDNTLAYFATGEGRVVDNDGSYEYQYNLKDHLGNVRVAFAGASGAPVRQMKHYYPFGLEIPALGLAAAGTDENKYQYNGKEIEDDVFDDDKILMWYHYGARYYDPQLGRWHSVDPKDEFYSTYTYVHNDPINYIDPDGEGEGHHYYPRAEFKKIGYSDEAFEVFDKATSGPLEKGFHKWDKPHMKYSERVGELAQEWLKDNNIAPSKMTAKQAKSFVSYIQKSEIPIIKNYLKMIEKFKINVQIKAKPKPKTRIGGAIFGIIGLLVELPGMIEAGQDAEENGTDLFYEYLLQILGTTHEEVEAANKAEREKYGPPDA